jgi:4-diphosphocytidyl-2-C-methyl-D-erythritol kinase
LKYKKPQQHIVEYTIYQHSINLKHIPHRRISGLVERTCPAHRGPSSEKGRFEHDFWQKKSIALDKSFFSMHNARMSLSQHATNHITDTAFFVKSYAKINLTLDVLGKRTDGYHELVTIMQTVDLYDTLCLTQTLDGGIRMICSRAELSNDHNLAVRAAQAVRQRFALKQGVVIELHKRIPVAAGLGGGSSNAAAVLLALRDWWHLPVSLDELQPIAATLGADVPFFLQGGLAVCKGRGEQVTTLVAHWPTSMRWLLLVKPAIEVSTASVFRDLTAADYSNGTHSQAVCTALQQGHKPDSVHLHNALAHGVLERYPEVAQAREAMLQAGASLVRLSGSGPTLFAPFATLEDAVAVQQRLHTRGYEVFLTRAIQPQ